MNIDVVGRIRPSYRGEGPHTLEVVDGHSLASRPGGTSFSFQQLHHQGVSNYDIFQKTVAPLVELWLAGFNTCLLVVGESGSGKSFTVAGESMGKNGLVPMLIDQLFSRIGEDDRYLYDSRVNENGSRVSLQMYEVYNELIKDLLKVPGLNAEYLDITEMAERGPHVKHGSLVPFNKATEGISLFRQGWQRRNSSYTDFGPAKNHAAVLVHLDLYLRSGESAMPNKSRFTIAVMPGVEKLAEDSTQLRLKEGPTLSKSLIAMTQVVTNLANQTFADRVINYTDSKLSLLLREELGGNCKTRVLACVKPQSDPAVLSPLLQLANQFTHVKNFPILNDPFALQLMTQYRARILHLQTQLGGGVGMSNPSQLHDVNDELRRLQTENLQLRDKNEHLHQKLEQLQGKFGTLASTKMDISAQLLMTEEEKLKVSKTLVDMQIENNKLKEEGEAAKFELTNKILQLENDMTALELDRDRQVKAARHAQVQVTRMEQDRKELADEYVVLKTNFMALKSQHDVVVAKNEELSVELLNLVNAKAALMKQNENRHLAQGHVTDPGEEVSRVRAIVSRLSTRRLNPEELSTMQDREVMEKNLFGDQRRFETEMRRIRNQYDDEQRKLEDKLTMMRKDLQDSRNFARQKQHQVSELNAQLLTLRNQYEQLQSHNNRLNHKMKDVNDEFRSRLVKYLEDIAEHIDRSGKSRDQAVAAEPILRKYVEEMVDDLKKAHRIREEQLSQAAQNFRSRMQDALRKHEELLVAYSELRNQIEDSNLSDRVNLGPDISQLQMSDPELLSAQQRQINRLREDLSQAANELETAKLRMNMMKMGGDKELSRQGTGSQSQDGEQWANLRRQIRDFTLTTQQELEEERAKLLTANAMLETQVQELQEYIDSHLSMYKDEIMKLRQKLGISDPGGGPGPLTDRHRMKKR